MAEKHVVDAKGVNALAFATLGSLWVFSATPALADASCSTASSSIDVEGMVNLNPNCVYTNTFVISKSNTTLDCGGATIDIGYGSKYGVLIEPEPGKKIANITVRNCRIIEPSSSGILVLNKTAADHARESAGADYLRSFSPAGVLIENVEVQKPMNAGVYLSKYTVGATVKNSTVVGSAGVCMYIDAYSKNNTVTGNEFRDCGFKDRKSSGGQRAVREGLAIDGASSNVIDGNVFDGNAVGGIFLYKNCSEDDAKTGIRTEPASYNDIRSNTFSNMPVGVWVASRQSRNLAKSDCFDKSPYPGDLAHEFFLDFAPHNKIESNKFVDIDQAGVRVEDDFTTIQNNTFLDVPDYLEVGAELRAKYLDKPVEGTVSHGNRVDGVPVD